MSRTLRNLLAAVAVAGLACGGGGGGPAPPTAPQSGIRFTAGSAAAPAVHLARGSGSTDSVLELEVRVDGVTGVYGAAFDLTFPGGLLDFQGFTEGSFLAGSPGAAGGGPQTSVQVAQSGAGRLVVGATRLGDAEGVDGSGVLLTLRFAAAGPGSGSIDFAANRLLDAAGDEIPGISWAGGTVEVIL